MEEAPPEFDVRERLQEFMDARGWTTYELSHRAGLAPSTLTMIFTRGSLPSLATIKAVCAGLGISMGQFFSSVPADSGPCADLMRDFLLLTEDQQRITRELVHTMAHPAAAPRQDPPPQEEA